MADDALSRRKRVGRQVYAKRRAKAQREAAAVSAGFASPSSRDRVAAKPAPLRKPHTWNAPQFAPQMQNDSDVLLDLLEKGKAPPRWGPWAMARFGGRVPLYGPVDRLVSAETAAGWLKRLLKLDLSGAEAAFTLVQLARLSGARARDIPQDLRIKAHAKLKRLGADARVLRPLEEVVHSEVKTQAEFYGDSLPIGLVMKDE